MSKTTHSDFAQVLSWIRTRHGKSDDMYIEAVALFVRNLPSALRGAYMYAEDNGYITTVKFAEKYSTTTQYAWNVLKRLNSYGLLVKDNRSHPARWWIAGGPEGRDF